MLRRLIGIGIHICVCGGSCGGKGRLICRSAAYIGNIVVVLDIGESLRRAGRFVGVGGSKINIPWVVGMSVAVCDTVRKRVSLVDIGLAGWSHSPAQ